MRQKDKRFCTISSIMMAICVGYVEKSIGLGIITFGVFMSAFILMSMTAKNL